MTSETIRTPNRTIDRRWIGAQSPALETDNRTIAKGARMLPGMCKKTIVRY